MIPRRYIDIRIKDIKTAIELLFRKDRGYEKAINSWEERFCEYLGIKYAIGVSSGRHGLSLILESLGLDKGDEIIIPAYTLKDLIYIIQGLGLKVVLADIDKESFNIDPGSILKRITRKTKVILATHLFGAPCGIERIMEIANKKSIFVIEDCAHSAGATFGGRNTGAFGHASFFSFETIKLVNTYGGGMVATSDKQLADKMRSRLKFYGTKKMVPFKKIFLAFLEKHFLPSFFSLPLFYLLASPDFNKSVASFYRRIQKPVPPSKNFSVFQSLLGPDKLITLKERITLRRARADFFKSLCGDNIIPQAIEKGSSSNCYFFVALLPDDPWKIRKSLLRAGIDAGVGAEIADDCTKILTDSDCPNAQEIFNRAIHLPIHEGASEKDIRYIADILIRALQ